MVQLEELQMEREAVARAEAEQNAAEEAELRRRYENEAANVKSLLARAEQRARTLAAAEEEEDHQTGSSSSPMRDGRTTLHRCVRSLVDVVCPNRSRVAPVTVRVTTRVQGEACSTMLCVARSALGRGEGVLKGRRRRTGMRRRSRRSRVRPLPGHGRAKRAATMFGC